MVLTAAVLGGFFGDSVPPGHGILAHMGSAAPPIGRNDGRTVLELRVRDPWSWQGDFQHGTRRVEEPVAFRQDIWKGGGDESTLRGNGSDATFSATSGGSGRRSRTISRDNISDNSNFRKSGLTMGKVKPGRSWITLDGTKSGKAKNKRRTPKAERTKPSVGTDGQELGEVEVRGNVRERTAEVTKRRGRRERSLRKPSTRATRQPPRTRKEER